MNFFQLIKSVLDDIYLHIPGTDVDKDAAIRREMKYLSERYGKILNCKETDPDFCIDYAPPERRFAYIFSYTTAHASYVHQLIQKHPELNALFERDLIRVSCVGGGPGSDFLGILKYMIRQEKRPRVTCYLYDKETAWGESWSDLAERLDSDLRIVPSFQAVDVNNETAWRKHSKYAESDLVTVIYFMSEVLLLGGANTFFEHLFESARPGTLFLFLDNNLPDVYGWFDDLARSTGVQVLVEVDKIRMSTTSDEEKTDIEPYRSKFMRDPKLSSWVGYRIARKP